MEENSLYEQYPLLWHLCSFLGSNPDYKPEIVTYPYVDFGKQEHTDNIQLLLIYSGCEFWVFAVTYFIFFILKIWMSVSRGCFLHICHSFLPPSLRGRKWPTSLPVSPLTHHWWWAGYRNIFRSTGQVHVQQVTMKCQFCVCICCVVKGSGCSAEMSGQEESGSGAWGQQCCCSYSAVSCLHTVRHISLWASYTYMRLQ